jgi:hypothetical protein
MKPEMKAKMKQILDDVLKQSGNPQATEQIPKFPIDRVKTGKDIMTSIIHDIMHDIMTDFLPT